MIVNTDPENPPHKISPDKPNYDCYTIFLINVFESQSFLKVNSK